MLLKLQARDLLVRVEDLQGLENPFREAVDGRLQWGEEEQDLKSYAKRELRFPSGEKLPTCWLDPDYRHDEVEQRRH